MDREKYRRLFVDEARENLSTYSNQLVAMEKAGAQGAADALDAVFRAAHSLKGMAASLGYGPFADLAHALEDLADLGRQGTALDESAIDLLLEGGDVLTGMVGDIDAGEEGGLDAGDLPSRLRAQMAALKGAPGPAAAAAGGGPGPPFAGQPGLVIEVALDEGEANVNVRAFMAHRALSALEGYLGCHPDVDGIKAGAGQGRFWVHYAPGTDEEVVLAKARSLTAVKGAERLEAASAPVVPEPAPDPVAAPAGDEGAGHGDAESSRVVVVQLQPDVQLPQVRAFMVHRTVSALPGYLRTEPSPEQIRSGHIPKRTLRMYFAATADLEDAARRASAEQGVASAVVEEQAAERPARAGEDKARRPDQDRTVRIRTALLDDFIDSVGELLLARSRLRTLATRYEAPELASRKKEGGSPRGRDALASLTRELGDLVDEIERMTRDLHDRVVSARMTPLGSITERFPPLVRSLARKLGKKVDFDIEGADIELDRSILDELSTPLIHMLRNAVDHAHEGTEGRLAAGKRDVMRLRLVASRDRDLVLIELVDDGGGIDPDRVRRRAVERGIIDEHQARMLSDAEAIELVCSPGFTTAAEVSETSGRGVGMDVVKATLERLGGSLRIRSELGRGTRFTLRLPLTVAIIQVLVVEAGGDKSCVYAIPVSRVDRAFDLAPSAVRESHGQRHVVLGEDLVPLFDLGRELGFDLPSAHGQGTAIVVGEDEGVRAFRVGSVVGQEEVVVKPLGPPLSEFDFLSGAALLADGRTAYILEPTRLTR